MRLRKQTNKGYLPGRLEGPGLREKESSRWNVNYLGSPRLAKVGTDYDRELRLLSLQSFFEGWSVGAA